ncbi:MAG: cupredoxin domain-containing protein [Acetobacteraceae bacterium]
MSAALLLAAALALRLGPASAHAAAPVAVVIAGHRFTPPEVAVPAGVPLTLRVENHDPTPEEFESHEFPAEKLVPGGGAIVLHIPPLKPGRYRFFGDYHPATAQGALVAR